MIKNKKKSFLEICEGWKFIFYEMSFHWTEIPNNRRELFCTKMKNVYPSLTKKLRIKLIQADLNYMVFTETTRQRES